MSSSQPDLLQHDVALDAFNTLRLPARAAWFAAVHDVDQLRAILDDPRIQGFTGSVANIDAIAKAYRVYHRKVPMDGGGYTVDHSAAVYLFDKNGRFVEPIGYGTPHQRVVDQLGRLAS